MKKAVFTFAILFGLLLHSQEKTNFYKQRLNNYLNKIENKGFNGSVHISYKGDVLVSRGLGYADVKNGIKNSSGTVFDIGSITKQFTGAAILKLEMQGKLKTSDKISKYLNGIPEDKKKLTLHHLLTHSSGLPAAIGDDYQYISQQGFIKQAMEGTLSFEPGTSYDYSNVGYTLLAMVIEKVSGELYENYLSENLWKPAGMYKTGYQLPKYDQEEIAVGYRSNKIWSKPNEKWDERGPSWHLKGNGGVLSTTEDLYKWHKSLLTNDILNKKGKEKYYKKHIKEGNQASSYYGYGWAIFPTTRGTELIAHNGGNGIFFADFWRYPTEEITVIITTNKAQRAYDDLASVLARMVRDPNYIPKTIGGNEPSIFKGQAVNEISDAFIKIISTNDRSVWKKFVSQRTTEEFKELTTLEGHADMFAQIHEELKGKQVNQIRVEGDELLLNFDDIEVTLGLEIVNEEILVSGILL